MSEMRQGKMQSGSSSIQKQGKVSSMAVYQF